MSGRCQDAGPSGKTTSNFARRLEELQLVAQQLGCSLIIGCKRRERGDSEDVKYNSVVFVDHDKGDFAYYDKKHLAPLLESRPLLVDTLGLSPPYWSRKPREPRFHRGSQQCCFELATESRTYRLATSICYDLFFPDEHRTMVERAADGAGLDFFVGATNERRAQGSTFPEFSLAMQRFRAIECRRAYVRNAEFGNSAIVDSRGRLVPTIRAEAAKERTILIGRVPISDGCTVYAVCGEWLAMVACGFISLMLIVSLGSRRTSSCVRHTQTAECRSLRRP
jgi:apolipoprotein N-acyltransferase